MMRIDCARKDAQSQELALYWNAKCVHIRWTPTLNLLLLDCRVTHSNIDVFL